MIKTMEVEVTTISSKGQVVIPATIRQEMGLSGGSKLMVLTDGDNLLLRPLQKPRLQIFRALVQRSEQYAKEVGLKKSDVARGLKKIRNESCS